MTAPEMVEVVAEVLRVHGFTELEHGYWYCSCGHELGVLIPDDLHAAHQARAVLAALTKAGTVEWGVRWGDGAWTGHLTQEQAKDLARGPGVESIVSRLTLPWAAVE